MTARISDLLTLFRKEMLMTLKDKMSRVVLFMPILVQTFLFGYVASYDLTFMEYALLDSDRSESSRELVARFDGSGIFHRALTLENAGEIADAVDNKKAGLVIHIGPGFERKLNAGQTVPVQVIVDGRNSNVAGTASGYATEIINDFSRERLRKQGISGPETRIVTRAWFNPNLVTRWNIISGMVAVLAVIQVMILSGQSVAREKEQGTFDQLLVTPFGPITLMLGKALPPVCVGLAQSSIVLLIALYWFRIPFAGSLLPLYVGLVIFNFTIVGIGLCISALSATMQQALLYSFSLLMPMVLLSGFATPIASMPEALQYATLLNPVRYGVEFAQRVYMEGAGVRDMLGLYWPLALMAVVTLGAASRLFRSQLG